MTDRKMVRVHSASNGAEAHLVRSALAQAEIQAEVRNEILAPLTGAANAAEVWVAEGDIEEARRILSKIRNPAEGQGAVSYTGEDDQEGRLSNAAEGGLSTTASKVCPSCNETNPVELGECWKCQADLLTDVPRDEESS